MDDIDGDDLSFHKASLSAIATIVDGVRSIATTERGSADNQPTPAEHLQVINVVTKVLRRTYSVTRLHVNDVYSGEHVSGRTSPTGSSPIEDSATPCGELLGRDSSSRPQPW